MSEGILGDPLRDAESLLSFIKMEDGLLTPNQVRKSSKTHMIGPAGYGHLITLGLRGGGGGMALTRQCS